MTEYLLGIDVGTTGTKCILLRDDGSIAAHAYAPLHLQAPAIGRSEQRAQDWWASLVHTVRETLAAAGVQAAPQVRAICLSTQGGTMLPADRQGNPLGPAVVWNDTRCAQQQADLVRQLGPDYMYRVTGWPLMPGLNALQIAWLRQNQPDIFKKAAYFFSVADYLAYQMTGRAVVDLSNAGINQLLNIHTLSYDEKILDFAGIDAARLAVLVPSGQPVGHLTQAAAQALGLSADVLLVAGAHDQYAACLGAGMTSPGDILIGSGTAWVVTALQSKPDLSKGFAQSLAAAPGQWGSLVALSSGGVCLDWLMLQVLANQGTAAKVDYEQLNEQVTKSAPTAGGLMFFPYFTGAFPLPLDGMRATFAGLDLSHGRYDLARAVMEGVGYHIAWVLEYFRSAGNCGKLILSGGATKSPVWRQMIADMANMPVYVPQQADLPCVGAAILAGTGSGLFASIGQGIEKAVAKPVVLEPTAQGAAQYAGYHRLYRYRAQALADMYTESFRATEAK